MIYLDLFSGAGGFAQGFIQAGFTFTKHYFAEIDEHASAVYRYRFPKAIPLGDITRIKSSDIERPDLITFGSPCQDVSIQGKRAGLKGKRSGLFFEAVRLIRECVPRVFVFENVKGLFSSNRGKDFETVLKTFSELGIYRHQWQLLNTRWVLPQNRERVYFVGTIADKGTPAIFPIVPDNQAHLSASPGKVFQVAPTLDTGIGEMTNRSPYVWHTNGKKVPNRIPATGTLRRLTPIESERLQGFPDNWTRYGIIDNRIVEMPQTERYIMMGNAVSVPVVAAVAERIKPFMSQRPSHLSQSKFQLKPVDRFNPKGTRIFPA